MGPVPLCLMIWWGLNLWAFFRSLQGECNLGAIAATILMTPVSVVFIIIAIIAARATA